MFLTDGREENVADLRVEVKKLQNELRERRQSINALEDNIEDLERGIDRLEGEKSKAQTRSRTLDDELRVTRAQVDELLSTNLDNENVIRMKVFPPVNILTLGLANRPTSREYSTASRT
jgi:chromosome segregation ATPase